MSNKPIPSREEVLALRKQYDAGTIIELIDIQDEWINLRPGDIGTVQYLDDAGQIQMRWRRGSRLDLIPGVGSFRIIGHEEYIYSCDEKTATDSFDSCESIGCIKDNAVVLFACREFFTCLCLALFPISRHVGNFLL